MGITSSVDDFIEATGRVAKRARPKIQKQLIGGVPVSFIGHMPQEHLDVFTRQLEHLAENYPQVAKKLEHVQLRNLPDKPLLHKASGEAVGGFATGANRATRRIRLDYGTILNPDYKSSTSVVRGLEDPGGRVADVLTHEFGHIVDASIDATEAKRPRRWMAEVWRKSLGMSIDDVTGPRKGIKSRFVKSLEDVEELPQRLPEFRTRISENIGSEYANANWKEAFAETFLAGERGTSPEAVEALGGIKARIAERGASNAPRYSTGADYATALHPADSPYVPPLHRARRARSRLPQLDPFGNGHSSARSGLPIRSSAPGNG